NEELNALCAKWRDLPMLALDTEFIRVDTFYPKLGLLQVCDGSASYLLDPLSLTDWQAFTAILSSHSVTKVLHSCSEDLVVFAELFHQVPYPLFDTQKAAAFLGLGYSVSYQNLVKEILDIEVEKGETRSDWLRRPLSREQVTYAALDVAYLPRIKTILQERLEAAGRLTWFEAECHDMVTLASGNIQHSDWHDAYLGMGAAWRLEEAQLGALQRLCQWRESEARRRNKPRSWIAKDTDLMALAQTMPASRADLQGIKDLSRHLLQYDSDTLLAIVARAHSGPALRPDLVEQPLTPEMRKQLKTCQEIVRNKAEALGVAPEMLARKKQLIPLINGLKAQDPAWP
ncbi:MAG: ribonuclease D, partial [Pseudomonas sp.]